MNESFSPRGDSDTSLMKQRNLPDRGIDEGNTPTHFNNY